MPKITKLIFVLVPALLTVYVGAVADDARPGPVSEVILVPSCTVEYARATTVASFTAYGSVSTRFEECLVKQGEQVKKGQLLGLLFRGEVKAEIETGTANVAKCEVEVRQKYATLALEKAKLQRIDNVNKRKLLLISAQEVQIQQIAVKLAELDCEVANQLKKSAAGTLSMYKAIYDARELRSPHDGIIQEILQFPGEALQNAKPIFRVVDLDNLKVTGYVDARDAWRVRAGQSVKIYPEIGGVKAPIARESFAGKLTFVDSEIDTKTQTCRVIAEIANTDNLLKVGLECRMEIDLGRPTVGKSRPDHHDDENPGLSNAAGKKSAPAGKEHETRANGGGANHGDWCPPWRERAAGSHRDRRVGGTGERHADEIARHQFLSGHA
jgi:RND family efflux transporter MFP subunit